MELNNSELDELYYIIKEEHNLTHKIINLYAKIYSHDIKRKDKIIYKKLLLSHIKLHKTFSEIKINLIEKGERKETYIDFPIK
jgi:hypothetical protein